MIKCAGMMDLGDAWNDEVSINNRTVLPFSPSFPSVFVGNPSKKGNGKSGFPTETFGNFIL
ncbi:MAG: hypothetical protein LBV16_02035 [Elusimicrobiota bacterium]|nr:hypothetical protein [Elusimicrobiota bacterium]